jgi:hypothetical protein
VTVPVGKLKATAEPLTSPSRSGRLPPRNTSSLIPAWSSKAEETTSPIWRARLRFRGFFTLLTSHSGSPSSYGRLGPFGPSGTGERRSGRWRMFAPTAGAHDVRVEINLVPAHRQPFTQQSAPSSRRVIRPPREPDHRGRSVRKGSTVFKRRGVSVTRTEGGSTGACKWCYQTAAQCSPNRLHGSFAYLSAVGGCPQHCRHRGGIA